MSYLFDNNTSQGTLKNYTLYFNTGQVPLPHPDNHTTPLYDNCLEHCPGLTKISTIKVYASINTPIHVEHFTQKTITVGKLQLNKIPLSEGYSYGV